MKKALTKSVLYHPILFMRGNFKSIFGVNIQTEQSIKLCLDWLLTAQLNGGDNGFSRGYYLDKIGGWDAGYIETSGYIVETLLKLPCDYQSNEVLKVVDEVVEFLLSKQSLDGYFPCIDNNIPQAFDTGQVLYGLLAYKRNLDKDCVRRARIDDAIRRACDWLVATQDEETGSWIVSGYRGIPHTYYTRVASILFECGLEYDEQKWKMAASKFMDWAVLQKVEDGSIKNLRFNPDDAYTFLHAMAYVIEGFVHFYELTRDDRYKYFAQNYYEFVLTKNNENVIPVSKYDFFTNPVDNQYCMTGLAQMAAVGMKLYTINDPLYDKIIAMMYFLKSHQIKNGKLRGGLWGSLPIWGDYARLRIPNWGVKFFLDALILYKDNKITLSDEEEVWIKESFSAQGRFIASKLSNTANMYFDDLIKRISQNDKVSDYGAGHGLFVKKLRESHISAGGFDPQVSNEYVTKIDSGSVDELTSDTSVIICIETVQHISDLTDLLKKLELKLKNDGRIIIYDRLATKLSHIYKMSSQLRNLSMYGAFSPFKENWYNEQELRKIVPDSLRLTEFRKLNTKGLRQKFFEPRFVAVLQKNLRK